MAGRLYAFFGQAAHAKHLDEGGKVWWSFGKDHFGWLASQMTDAAEWMRSRGFPPAFYYSCPFGVLGPDQPFEILQGNLILPRRRGLVRDLHEYMLSLCGGDGRRVLSYVGGCHFSTWASRTIEQSRAAFYKALWCIPAACDLGFDAVTRLVVGSKAWRILTASTYRRAIARWAEPNPLEATQAEAWGKAGLNVIEASDMWGRHGKRRYAHGRHLLIAHENVRRMGVKQRVLWVQDRLKEQYDVACPISWFTDAGM